MSMWGGGLPPEYPYVTDQDEGLDKFSLCVIGAVFIALTAWGLWVALHGTPK